MDREKQKGPRAGSVPIIIVMYLLRVEDLWWDEQPSSSSKHPEKKGVSLIPNLHLVDK